MAQAKLDASKTRQCDQASPFQHLLDFGVPNNGVTSHTRQELKSFIGALRSEHAAAKAKAERLRAASAAADADCSAIDAKMKAHIALFPPIHDMPIEILTKIFSLIVDPPFDLFKTSGGIASPWSLGGVCRRWREVAWGTPRLWCSFRADWSQCIGPLRVQHVKTILARSGDVDLSTNLVTLPSILALFIGHASRLSNLNILCTPLNLGELLILGHLSSLKKLRLQVAPIEAHFLAPHWISLDISLKAPLLVDVELQLDGHLPTRDTLILPWTQLTRLKVRGLIISRLDRQYFPLCPNLVILDDLAGGYALEVEEMDSRNAITTLDSLQILNTSYLQRLRHLRCPKLQVLHIVDIVDKSSRAILQDFLVRSQCAIQTLKMRIVDRKWEAVQLASWQSFAATLSAVPSLELEFNSLIFDLETIFASLEYAEAKTLFPCLQSLVIRTRTVWDSETQLSVVRMIESRCKVFANQSKLRSVLIEYWPTGRILTDVGDYDEIRGMEILSQLKALEKDGLGVRIVDKGPR